jgi:outer membrane protein OmpA-like peptidoglycan-associated protein
LSERRARSVAAYLITKGVPSTRVEAAGRGEAEPVQTNDTDAGRSANRRVEVAVFAGDQMKADAKKQAGPPPGE